MAVEGFRLSPQQKHLWELKRHPAAYCAQCAVVVKNPPDTEALKRAIQKIADRHEILRTTFQKRAGLKAPMQVIRDSASLQWAEIDLQVADESSKRATIERILRQNRESQFDYEGGPLIDLLLLRLGPEEHILSIRLPVLCADALTLANVVREIAAFLSSPGDHPVEEEVVQYLQFSEWQNELLEDVDSKLGLEFWQKRIEELGPALQLPFANSTGDPSSFEPSSVSVSIDPGLVFRMESVAAECGNGLLTFLLACWQVLLWKLTGQSEITIAHALDGRKFEELRTAMGFFSRSVPLRALLDKDLRFFDVLRRAGDAVKRLNEWQEFFVPADGGEGSGKEGALPAAFEYLDWPLSAADSGVSFSLYQRYVCWDRFEVKLSCLREKDSLIAEIEYDRNSIHEDDARCLAGQLGALIETAAAAPLTRIRDLEVLSDEERQRIVVFNDTSTDWLDEKTVREMFEQQTAEIPSAIALVFEDQFLSYGELNRRANVLANHLRNLGVGPEVPVVLLLDRSLEVIVSLLAVLKAGGAYVPLDGAQPRQRLALFLEETRARVVITQERFVAIFAGADAALVVVDRELNTFGLPDVNPNTDERPENLAYILFTSGSTGNPKGVMVENRQLSNYVRSIIAKLDQPGPSHLAMVSTFAADLGNTVLFPSLCSGKCLHLLSQEAAFDIDAFTDYFERHEIDCLKIVPSHFANVLTSVSAAKVIPRGALILGGEASEWKLIDRILELSPDCRIINHYGPTETTVGVMTHELERDGGSRRDGGMPLGRPLPNTRAYLLDGDLYLAATNVDAGLYIGGAGLARGYMNHTDLTAEKFIPDPFSKEAGNRLYQTGDLARLLPDGSVKFLGRIDHQVKIRGFRVELGEIETVLRQHLAVRNAVVEVSEHESGGSQLLAYIVPRSTDHPAEAELHAFLRSSLPDYMLPASYVFLESLPLTANGKIDRRALVAADNVRTEQIGTFVGPRGLGEELMASLWREVLGVDQLSVHDSFLRVGGDSLLATQLVSRVRKTFQVELPVQSIFDAPTISEFTLVVERAMQSGEQPQFSPVAPVPRAADLPLSFAQERLWGIHQLDPQSPVYNSTLYQYLNGPLNVDMFERALNEIVSRHEVLRTTFPNVEGIPAQVISPPSPISIRRLDLDSRPEVECGSEVHSFIEAEQNLPFDLGRGPLLRVSVLKINPERHVVLFTLHHIICDGWSLSIFIRELSMLYDSFCQGIVPRLPELPVQYADFAFWQRQVLQGEVLERLLSYWTRQLSGAPEVINLPADYPRPKHQTFKGGAIFSRRPPELLAALNSLSKTEGVTLFMTLLAAFYTLLYHYTGQEDLVAGTDVANRNHVEVENLMGFFINNLVLRADLSGNPTFRELLGQVRKTALEAYAHQDLPFATLVKALRVKRSLSHTPLFQVLFVLQNNPAKEYKSSSLRIEHVEAEYSASKFDLAYFATETTDGLTENWCYSTELFDPATVSRMSSSFETLLENIVKEPDARLGKLKALGEADKKRSQRKWSMTRQSSEDLDWPGGPS